MSLKLHTIICSTRPGRVGASVARWFHDLAAAQSDFDAELVDLADFNLPIFDEPHHPAMQNYQHEHTRRWAASVQSADAFVFVTPEYNYGPPPALLNALNYVYREWNYKPAGIVSYGGVSGGLRAAQMEKQTFTTLKMMPMVEAVAVQNVARLLDADQVFQPEEFHISSASSMLAELARWATALKTMR